MQITLIKNRDALHKAGQELSKLNEIAVDLEFDRHYHRYGFNLCLMQIYGDQTCYLIDPLSRELEINQIFPILENPAIQKIVFSFGEDLRLLHSLHCFPKNLFDLSIAASLLNYPQVSLSNLLIDVLGIDTTSNLQTSNWYKRPLNDNQIQYAADDVIYLKELKKEICMFAKKKRILNWIAQENQSFESKNYAEEAESNYLKEKDKKGMNEVEWYLFKKLMEYREEKARELNRPAFQVVQKKILKQIAAKPTHVNNWLREKGIHRQLKKDQVRKELQNLIQNGLNDAESQSLSPNQSARRRPDRHEKIQLREQRVKLDHFKKTYFQPIKEKIALEFGDETASFLLSNRIIQDIVSGSNGQLEEYKKDLFIECAKSLNLATDKLNQLFQRNGEE